MQWRMLGIVAALAFVLWAAFEARKPETWRWITRLEELGPEQEPALDPRLSSVADESPQSDELIVGEPLRKAVPAENKNAELPGIMSPNDRAWADGWMEVFGKLSYYDRTTLYDLLKAARDQEPASAETQMAGVEALNRLDRAWADYRAVAKTGLADLTEEERAAWEPILEHVELRWSVETKPLLMILSQGQPLETEHRERLFALQDLLDRLQLKGVVDNTPWRASDREIWFRLFGKLMQRTPEELKRASEGTLGYAQLFRQATSYRGKVITVRGTAQAVYSVPAPQNAYGIKQYWVYWLQPEGGPNSPILVYALEKPEGVPFIEFAELGKAKMQPTPEVEFTGIFFKKYAYQGEGGLYTAPMLLARRPMVSESSLSQPVELPSLGSFLLVAAGLALLATCFAVWVYYQYRPGRSPDRQELPERIVIKN